MIGLLKRAVKRALAGSPSHAAYKFVMKDWAPLFDLEASAEVLETKRFSQNLKPVELQGPSQRKIMVIAPHPDDEVFGAGGTLLKALARGAEVHIVYVTDGENDERREAIRDDAVSSCKALGVSYTFLGCETLNIPLSDGEVNQKLSWLLHEIRPEAMFIPFLLDDHDDHRRASELFMTVARESDLGRMEIWAYQVYSTVLPNVVVNITEQADRKRELIGLWRHVSGNRDWAHYVMGTNAANCRYISSKEPLYAETFFVVPVEDYLELCGRYFSRGPARVYYSNAYRAASVGQGPVAAGRPAADSIAAADGR